MAKSIRNLTGLIGPAVQAEMQKLRADLLGLKAGTISHADASAAVSTANASDLPTSVALANALKAAYNGHIASVCDPTSGQGAHLAADSTNPTVAADATDLASVETLINDIKAKYNAHRALAASHASTDTTNVVTAADATDQASANTLANDIKTQLNRHFARAFAHSAIALVSP